MGEYGIGILHQHLVYGVHEDGRSRVVNWVGQVRRIFISLHFIQMKSKYEQNEK